MSSTVILINLFGAAALLIWGLRMLKSGVQDAFGTRLRLFLAAGTRNRLSAFGVGLLTTLALQSSTATAMIASSFAGEGLVTLAMGQAVMLGANVGTSLVTQVLVLDVKWLSPALLLMGVIWFSSGDSSRRHGVGQALVGLGLMLLSLRLLGEATVPLEASQGIRELLSLLGGAPLIAVLAAAALAAVAASSLAVVLFVVSLAVAGAIDAPLCLYFVAGANLGGAVPPLLLAMRHGAAARQLAAANLGVRAAGAIAVVALLPSTSGFLAQYPSLPRLVVDAHVGFNLLLAVVFLPLVGWVAAVAQKLVPLPPVGEEGPIYLDEAALATPQAALAAAMRETLRVGDTVEKMLEASLGAFRRDDEGLCLAISKMDDKVDRLQEAIKLYLSRLGRQELEPGEIKRAMEITSYAINLEHIGDVIDKNLAKLALKKIHHQVPFSAEGFAEIEAFYLRTVENLHLAQVVFTARDLKLARKLVEGKVTVRQMERQSSDSHLKRLQDGRLESIQTSALHLDILRDLKRVNSHIASVAYPILDEFGELRESRLKSRGKA